jgi:hypothetical protein
VIPRPQQALNDLAMKLMLSIAPQTQSTYAATSAGLIGMLMQCLAQDFDRAAAVRVADLDEMATLFRAAPASASADLRATIQQVLEGAPASLRIADLTARHAQAMQLLIDLHAWTEVNDAQQLNREIWQFLIRHADRHAYQVML